MSEIAQKLQEAPHQSNDSRPEGDTTTREPLTSDTTANIRANNWFYWPNYEAIAWYIYRCARHKSECERMQVELRCFIAHLGVVGGDKNVIESVENLWRALLSFVDCLEKALHVTPDGRGNAMSDIIRSLRRLSYLVSSFAWSSSKRQNDVLYPIKLTQWGSITINGYTKSRDLIDAGKLVECLGFIHHEFLSALEAEMGGVIEALMTFEEKSASEWLAECKTDNFDVLCKDYIGHVFASERNIWPQADTRRQLTQRCMGQKWACDTMRDELGHLIAHYGVVGGDNLVINSSKLVQGKLSEVVEGLQSLPTATPQEWGIAIVNAVNSFKGLHSAVVSFEKSLYHQKHAFYFRKVKQWSTCLSTGLQHIESLSLCRPVRFLEYIFNVLSPELEVVMLGISNETSVKKFTKIDVGSVAEELKTYGKEFLPKFLADQMERDTTRYVNLTTIATFFSSVTATTLQFTYAETDAVPSNSMRGVVNLFWFLSLVFSVSSGVSSLLGLTWRKSSIYDTRVPPRLIRMWFDKAPMLFLIIAAVAFVIGLNLFAYLSLQPRFVSYATNILTGLHGICLLAVTLWFIYQLKHDSIWAGWIRAAMKPITTIADWIIEKVPEWIRKNLEWIRAGIRWIWKMANRQYDRFKPIKFHLLRNIFWALGIDNRVARLNLHVYGFRRDWPEPYLLSKLIRLFAYPIKKCWLAAQKLISDLGHILRKHLCVASRAVNTEGALELGERGGREDSKMHEESSPEGPVGKAKKEFRRSLQKIFSDAANVEKITSEIEHWARGYEESAEEFIGKKLWGYPALRNMFFDVVRPALVEARENKRMQIEMEVQELQALAHIDTNSPHPTVDGEDQDEDETTSVTRQIPSSPLASPDVTPELPGVAEIDVHQDSQAHPVDQSPSSDKLPSPTASEDREGLELMSGDPTEQLDSIEIFPLDVSDVNERSEQQNEIDQHNEIDSEEIQEIPSTSENTIEGSCIAQSKESESQYNKRRKKGAVVDSASPSSLSLRDVRP